MDVCSPSPKGEGDAWLVSYCCFWFLLEARDFSHVRLHECRYYIPEIEQEEGNVWDRKREDDYDPADDFEEL